MFLNISIKKKYKEFDLNIKFKSNSSVLGILGSSGAGKSIILKILSGIIIPDKGKIEFNNNIFFNSKKNINLNIKDRKIGYLFQDYALFPNMNVKNNISFGLYKEKKEVINFKTNKIIKELYLSGLENRFSYELSVGQKQRVALARALILKPKLLLLDEPFSSLDSYLRFELIELLKENLKKFKGQTIFVTHNIREAYRLCDEIIILENGKIKEKGTKDFIFLHPSTRKTLELIGCKNISKVKKIENKKLLSIDWGIVFNIKKSINKKINYIGFRDNFFNIKKQKNDDNCFDFVISNVIKNPNTISLYCKFLKSNKNLSKYHIHWEITSFYFEKIKKNKNNLKLYFNSDNLIII